MPEPLVVLASVCCIAWFWLLLFRDNFWRADQRLPRQSGPLLEWPAVVAIVPARNEADVIAQSIASLDRQDYPGPFSIILVDDHSMDGTTDIARAVATPEKLTALAAPPLLPGWTGKLAAMNHGSTEARRLVPDHAYILFTDADIEHPSDLLRRLVMMARRDHKDLVSLMVRLHCTRLWERLLVPAFVFFFQKLYPFPAVNDDANPAAAAAGGCILLRRDSLDSSGGLEAIRGALIDDCALAASIKKNRGRLWLGLAEDSRSIRPYSGLGEIWRMVARTAYTQLDLSPLKLVGATLGMAIIYLAGPLLTLSYAAHEVAYASAFGLLCWLLMSAAYIPTLRYYGQPVLMAVTLPAVAFLYMLMTVDSAWRHHRRRGGAWKGRTYS